MTRRLEKHQAEALLKVLFGLLKSRGFYPAGHTVVNRAGESLERALRDAFSRPDPLLLARADGYLVVGDVPFLGEGPQSGEFSRRLEARGLEGVILEPGVQAPEVAHFLDWLSSGDGSDWKGLHVSTTSLSRDGAIWKRALRLYGSAREAVEEACGEVESGRIPDPSKALECVSALSELLSENPSMVSALSLIKDYDRYTFHHSVNVCVLALGLTRQLAFADDETELAGVGGLFHDIGKTQTPVGVIRKPGRLSSDEWVVIRRHPLYGRDILDQMPSIAEPIPLVVYEHHMRYDGGGYPGRPQGANLHPLSLAVSVADVYDAMTSHRPYHVPLPLPTAIETMVGMKSNHLEPRTVDAFVAIMGPFPVGSLVRMSAGEVAVVSKIGQGGAVTEVIVVVEADGTEIPRERQTPRLAQRSDVAGIVGPLYRRIDPFEVIKPRN